MTETYTNAFAEMAAMGEHEIVNVLRERGLVEMEYPPKDGEVRIFIKAVGSNEQQTGIQRRATVPTGAPAKPRLGAAKS